jgi:hypothetical protein
MYPSSRNGKPGDRQAGEFVRVWLVPGWGWKLLELLVQSAIAAAAVTR